MKLSNKGTFLPSAFTAGNIFCGFFAMISAIRGDLEFACWMVVLAGLLDFIDGKVALFSNTESNFGTELDSLADLSSFGIAPGIIMYHFFLSDRGDWSWLVSFLFVLCGALRLARFNVETAGAGKKKFKGLPIPMAAACLIGFVPFSNSELFRMLFSDVNYNRFLVSVILILAGLMVSTVEYPVTPRINLSSFGGKVGLVAGALFVFCMIYFWKTLLFPFSFLYAFWGFVRTIALGAVSRLPEKNSG
ncbi:MAG: CDP-diacylglycerol--serine O-phosphatidyltransferase [Candidatus Glassbacteria bacterium]|nr:CDP-diacylglycerol--serine O-phosphatidyltransferase [Candidatus Glassbacteria bacterium]